jgi:hypothetical protein
MYTITHEIFEPQDLVNLDEGTSVLFDRKTHHGNGLVCATRVPGGFIFEARAGQWDETEHNSLVFVPTPAGFVGYQEGLDAKTKAIKDALALVRDLINDDDVYESLTKRQSAVLGLLDDPDPALDELDEEA